MSAAIITNIRHTGIVVDDLDASLHFYQDLLGMSITKRMLESGTYIDRMSGLDAVEVTTVKMSAADGNLIELLYYHSHRREAVPSELCEIGIRHIAFGVSDLDKTYQTLVAAGVPFNAEPQYSPDGYAKVTFCRAPEGTMIELVEVL